MSNRLFNQEQKQEAVEVIEQTFKERHAFLAASRDGSRIEIVTGGTGFDKLIIAVQILASVYRKRTKAGDKSKEYIELVSRMLMDMIENTVVDGGKLS